MGDLARKPKMATRANRRLGVHFGVHFGVDLDGDFGTHFGVNFWGPLLGSTLRVILGSVL